MGEPPEAARSPGRCWDCGSPHLRPLPGDGRPRFRCASCSACWVVEGGSVRRVVTDGARPSAEPSTPAR